MIKENIIGVSLELVNNDDLFQKYARSAPIIINDFQEGTETDKEAFDALICTKYSGDALLSNLPRCECGSVIGEYNIGVVCKNCNTPVKSLFEDDLEPIVWVRKPAGVAKLINPIVWTMLTAKFTKSGFDVVRWLCDTTYHPTVKMPLVMESIMSLNLGRGYNNFIDNFDKITDMLFNLKEYRLKKNEIDPLQILLKEQRNCVFSDFLPLPNRSLLVIEDNTLGTFVDPIVIEAIDSIRTMMSIDSPLNSSNVRTRENRTIKHIAQLALFYDGVYTNIFAKKEGLFRKHVFGTRSHFSFRAVITSLTAQHNYQELHIPWGIAVSSLQIHLLNKLYRRGFRLNEAKGFLDEYATKYHPLLEELFIELIEESPYPGIPCVFQRNPSLERASAQLFFITHVKSDPSIATVSMSILSTVGFNADFDGDMLNCTLNLDHLTTEELEKLAPHKSVFNLDKPRKVSKNLSMPKPVVATLSSWMNYKENEIDPAKLQKMEELYC